MATQRATSQTDAIVQPPSKADRPFAVRRSAIQGRGAFATRDIKKGERLVEYVGERISREEGDLRYDDDATDRPHTFLFTLDDETAIDGAVRGNDSRYINHSCGPNCESVIEDGHIFIDAIKDIKSGAELTYDYHLVRPGRFRKEWRKQYECRCGARNCRGMLLELPPSRTKKTAKKATAKKSGARKATAKKATAKRSGAKGSTTKSTVRKSTAKKSGAKRATTTKATATKATRAGSTGAKRAVKSTAKRGAAKAPSGSKSTTKKSVATRGGR